MPVRFITFALTAFAAMGAASAAEVVMVDLIKDSNIFSQEVHTRFDLIRDEATHLPDHEWAGVYYEGNGFGENVYMALSPNAGVAATWNGCVGEYRANHGAVLRSSEGALRFRFKQPNSPGFGGFPNDVQVVQWGERHYLIPEAQMLAFVNAINRGDEPRPPMWGHFLLKEGDEEKPVLGLPSLMPRYQSLIRRKAVAVHATSVTLLSKEDDGIFCAEKYELQLDHGTAAGLIPGVELEVTARREVSTHFAVVISVEQGRSKAHLTRLTQSCKAAPLKTSKLWSMNTGAFDVETANAKVRDGVAEYRKDIASVSLPPRPH